MASDMKGKDRYKDVLDKDYYTTDYWSIASSNRSIQFGVKMGS